MQQLHLPLRMEWSAPAVHKTPDAKACGGSGFISVFVLVFMVMVLVVIVMCITCSTAIKHKNQFTSEYIQTWLTAQSAITPTPGLCMSSMVCQPDHVLLPKAPSFQPHVSARVSPLFHICLVTGGDRTRMSYHAIDPYHVCDGYDHGLPPCVHADARHVCVYDHHGHGGVGDHGPCNHHHDDDQHADDESDHDHVGAPGNAALQPVLSWQLLQLPCVVPLC